MADDGDGKPTVDAKPRRARVPADTDPVPLATLAEPTLARYWHGVETARGPDGRSVEAIDTLLGRGVALKAAVDQDPEGVRRFVRETRITARLEHPAIPPLYDAGTGDDGAPFYVTRKLVGQPLGERVRAAADLRGRLALLPHVVAAAQALAHAHALGICHRDVRPANVLVGPYGETSVIGWGYARGADESDDDAGPGPGAAAAPGFVAPEIRAGRAADARGDVYALGALLYELLAGAAPMGATASALRGAPPALAAIADRALRLDPYARYADAGEVAEALARFGAEQLGGAAPRGRLESAQRLAHQHPVIAALAAVALAAGGVGVVVAFDRARAARDTALARADAAEAARDRAAEHADALALANAQLLAASDPAAGLALARPFAAGPRWREVHALAAGAQAAGIPWRLPETGAAVAVALAPDGARAVTLDDAGQLRLYDLRAHTGRQLAVVSSEARAVAFAGDAHVLAWGGDRRQLVIVSADGGAGRAVELAAPIAQLATDRQTAYWADTEGHGWHLDPQSAPTRLPVDDALVAVFPAPDGARAVACGRHAAWLVSAGPAQRLAEGPALAAGWDDLGQRVALATPTGVVVLALDGGAPPHRLAAAGAEPPLFVGDAVATAGPDGVRREDVLVAAGAATLGAHRAGSRTVVAVTGRHELTILDGAQHLTLALPGPPIAALATAATTRARRVVALAGGAVTAWDLDAVLPRVLPTIGPRATLVAAGPHALYAAAEGRAMWVDLATGETRPAPAVPRLVRAIGEPGGARVVLVPAVGAAVLAHAGEPTAITLGAHVDAGGFAAGEVFVGAAAGALVATDLGSGAHRTLAPLAGPLAELQVAGRWALARGTDGALLRVGTESSAAPEARAAPGPRAALLLADGRVLVATGVELAWWDRGASDLALHVRLPQLVASLASLDDAHALATDTAGVAYIVDLRAPHATALPAGPAGVPRAAPAAQLMVRPAEVGARVLDLASGAAWDIARSAGGPLPAELAPDGSALYAPTPDGLAVWPVEPPRSPAATAAYLAALAPP